MSCVIPYLIISAVPERISRAETVCKYSASITIIFGFAKTPIWFFKTPKSTPVFPPTEASTMLNKVVGMFTKSIPLLNVEATKPPKSVITPPPKVISKLFLSAPNSVITFQTPIQVSMFL